MFGRVWVGLGSLALGFAAASAHAQSLSPSSASTPIAVTSQVNWDDGLGSPTLLDAAFGTNALQSSMSGPQTAVTPSGVVGWTSSEAWIRNGDASVDRLRVASGSAAVAAGAPVWLNPNLGDQIYDVSFTRGWPRALSLRTNGYGMDVTPHAGFGVTSFGESAEAGATFRFGGADALDQLGQRHRPGHWYFYAQTSGRAVGYNLGHVGDALNFNRSNLFLQSEPGLMNDSEAGIAWRRGALQASFGYSQRGFYLQNMRDVDFQSHESVIGFTLSFRPR